LIQNKPVIALSDHAKLDSLVTDFGLAQYRVSLASLGARRLIDKFKQLEDNSEQLIPYIKAGSDKYRRAVDVQFVTILPGPNAAGRTAEALS
jgi:hypothetical protein